MNRAIAVVFIAWSSAALAQATGAQAEVLFRQGRDLLAAGKVAEACSAFAESQKLEPAVTTLLNLAGCREKLGQLATAWGLFLDAARQTRSAADAASQQFHHVAQARAQTLEPRVSRLTINVPQQSQIDGLQIARGTDRISAVMWNRALPVDGGTYTITARVPGSNPWSTQVTVAAENETKTVEIPDLRNLPRDLDKPATPPPPAVVVVPAIDPSNAPPHASSKVVPLVVGAGALALFGGGLGFELWAESRYAAAKSEMTSQPRRDSLYNSANRRRYVAEALAVSGLAAGGAAVWLYLRDDNRERAPLTDAGVHVVPMASGLALSGQF
jgi:serine/threonine-protein kinase